MFNSDEDFANPLGNHFYLDMDFTHNVDLEAPAQQAPDITLHRTGVYLVASESG